MDIPEFIGDSQHSNLKEYAEISESIWSSELSIHSKQVELEYRQKTVLHARFGDLVTGQWRNWVDPTKYITAIQIDEVIRENKSIGIETHLISDSEEVFQIFPSSRTSKSLATQNLWAFDDESLRTIEDLFKMKSSRELITPEASAFSKLGARLGGKEPRKLIRKKLNIWQAVENVEATKVLWSRGESERVAAFLSRDIDQQINALSGVYDLSLFGEITEAALDADPKNVQSLNNRAIFFALIGDFEECQTLLAQARALSLEVIGVHHDPLFITTTTESLVQIVSEFSKPSEEGSNQLIGQLEEKYEQLSSLGPYQLDKAWVLRSLSDIRLFHEKRIRGDKQSNVMFQNEILVQVKHNRFVGASKNVFVLNLLEYITKLLAADAVVQERDSLLQERDALVQERDGLVQERDGLAQERDALVQERDAILSTKTWRWLKPLRTSVAWIRSLHRPNLFPRE
jgi:hypothetical protein